MASRFQHLFYKQIMPQLPKKWVSHALGSMAHWKLPASMNQKMINKFVEHYQIDPEECAKLPSQYDTLGDFFSRSLRPGARPIEGDIIHPCDGVLIQSGLIHDDLLIQAKGKTFSLDEFVPDNPWSGDFEQGSFFTYYLAPHNYHRVHMPVSGEIHWSVTVPGELWPVNSWSVQNISKLYVNNERVIAGVETPQGRAIVVMVGATNVGSISVSFDPNIRTNRPSKKEVVFRKYDKGRTLQVGEEFGTFHLGSTVVVIYDKSWQLGHQNRQKVLMGQALEAI